MDNTDLLTVPHINGEIRVFLKKLLKNGGPEPSEYERFIRIINDLEPEEIEPFREVIRPSLDQNTMQGFGFVKPYGYPGDFMIIDRIYKYHKNADTKYTNWDNFYHEQHAPQAVRNRKDYFKTVCKSFEEKSDVEKRMLILGCGPATDVREYLLSNRNSQIRFDLVDWDQNAIDYATENTREF
ncbi:MAG: hypothetical protein JSV24_03115, partial [Bacteroidales bacterium]